MRRSVPFALGGALAILAGAPAAAATIPEACLAAGTAGASSASLIDATRAAEAMLSGGGAQASDLALARLEAVIADAPGGDAGALAGLCAAAGEAYRTGARGSPFQAQQTLLGAFRLAERAGRRDLGALAAYRIGMVAASGTLAATGVRGARRSGGTAAAEAQFAPDEAASETCPWLTDPRLASKAPGFVTYVALQCSVDRARAGGAPDISARAGLRLARFWSGIAAKQPENAVFARGEGLKAAREALAAALPGGDPQLIGRLLDTALDAGGSGDALVRDGVARLAAAAGDDPKRQAAALGLQARLALAAGDRGGAAALLRRATFHEAQAPLPERLADWYLLLAEAEPARRDAHVAAAFRALQGVRPALAAYDPLTEESLFALRLRPVFEALVDTMLAATPEDDPVAIAAVQQIVEEYRQAELQSLFGSECVPPRPPIRPEELSRDELLLYPILLPDRIELLYASGADGRYRRLPPNRGADRARVAALVARMVEATSYGSDGWRAPARELYQILIAPIEARLSPEATLVVIPDGPLSALPFAALTDADGRFLVERSRLSTVPALAYAQPGAPRETARFAVLAAALEKEVVLPAGIFPRLTGTGEEARFAYAIAGGAGDDTLIENFRRADLVRALGRRRVDVLHLATHAAFNGRSDRSYIVADGEAIPIAELRGLIAANQTRGDQLDLLILSACETAVGDDQASMGLAGAAVQAGARSALASLWQVSDAGTRELMKAFYTRYRDGRSKAEALRGAQVELIRGGGDFGDPNVWAAFTLLGGWR